MCSTLIILLRLLRADQKAKARTRLAISPSKPKAFSAEPLVDSMIEPNETAERVGVGDSAASMVKDDMVFFWQCQSPGQTGDLKGCGFFRILDMIAEGRGPCVGDV